MSDGFNQGLLGIPTGSAANSAGLMLSQANQAANDGATITSPPPRGICKANEVQWHSEGDCFTPSQVHVNALEISIAINVTLLIVFAVKKLLK